MRLHQGVSGDTKSFLVSGLKNVGSVKVADQCLEIEILVRWCEWEKEVLDLRDSRRFVAAAL